MYRYRARCSNLNSYQDNFQHKIINLSIIIIIPYHFNLTLPLIHFIVYRFIIIFLSLFIVSGLRFYFYFERLLQVGKLSMYRACSVTFLCRLFSRVSNIPHYLYKIANIHHCKRPIYVIGADCFNFHMTTNQKSGTPSI